MKKIYLTAISIMFLASVNAQFTITATNNPVAGDKNEYYLIDTTGVGIGTNGAGQLWNYTSLNVSTPTLTTESYVTPSSTPYGGSFPSATIASSVSTTPGDYNYFNYSASSANLLGSSSGTNIINFSNPATLYTIPFSFGSSSADTFSSTSTFSGITVDITGTITATGVGTGTLNLPSGLSFNNVLKVKIVQDVVINFGGFGSQTTTSTSYSWLNAMSKFPLLTVTNDISSDGVTTSYDKNVQINKISYVGVTEKELNKLQFTLYPNPTTSNTIINFDSPISENVTATIVNALGENVKTISLNVEVGSNSKEIDLSGFTSGLYFVKLTTKRGSNIQKVIVD